MLNNILYLLKKRSILKRSESIFCKAARFVACEQVEGDYLEFGVYQGSSFIQSYTWLQQQFINRSRLDTGGESKEELSDSRLNIWNKMRFIAFDSFEGLPQLSEEDQKSVDFKKGQYSFSEPNFLKKVNAAGVPLERTVTVKGFFKDTCTPKTRSELNIQKAAIIWFDADLYSSTIVALTFITPLLQDGTILIFDDWFSYRGHPEKGVQKAFYEWAPKVESNFRLIEYQKDTWKRMSFIASKK